MTMRRGMVVIPPVGYPDPSGSGESQTYHEERAPGDRGHEARVGRDEIRHGDAGHAHRENRDAREHHADPRAQPRDAAEPLAALEQMRDRITPSAPHARA